MDTSLIAGKASAFIYSIRYLLSILDLDLYQSSGNMCSCVQGDCVLRGLLSPRLGGGNGMEWKGMKRIILEYSSIPLFGSFNGGDGKSIPLFGSLNGRKLNG